MLIKSSPSAILVLCILLASPMAASGARWYVDGSVSSSGKGTSWEDAFQTIQEGIDVAENRDTVIVARGTYGEQVHFGGKEILLTSEDPLNPQTVDRTIIDAQQGGSVVTFAGTEGKGCTLTGFTIRGGKASTAAGIRGNGTLALIRYNVVTGNETSGNGGGLRKCLGMIRDNDILLNVSGGSGGGLYDCDGTIQGNNIVSNQAVRGGGLAGCGGTVQDNTIESNQASENGGGLDHCHGTVRRNDIQKNLAEGSGGGLAFCNGEVLDNLILRNESVSHGGGLYGCDAVIRNNQILGNRTLGGGGSGGGLSTCVATVIEGNEIFGNAADNGGGLHACSGSIRRNWIHENGVSRHGGGLYKCSGDVEWNTIVSNSAVHGGGLYECSGVIGNNQIRRNTATPGDGGGLFGCVATTQNNLISGNRASVSGGGLHQCSGTIRGNTIVDNVANEGSGGGLSSCQADIHNCIIWGNSAGGGLDQISGSSVPEYCCIQGGGIGNGNLFEDPSFADRDGEDNDPSTDEDNDYRLSEGSPCAQAGNSALLGTPPGLDLDGNLRNFPGVVDIGAYELYSVPMQLLSMTDLGREGLQLIWLSQPGDTYTVWSRAEVHGGTWVEEATVSADLGIDLDTAWVDEHTADAQKYYRIEMNQ